MTFLGSYRHRRQIRHGEIWGFWSSAYQPWWWRMENTQHGLDSAAGGRKVPT